MRFNVISYNIHKGLTAGNRRLVLEEMRRALASHPADLIFLQEVVGAHTALADRFDHWPSEPHCSFLAGTDWPFHIYGGNARYPEGHHGNAILSKFPLQEVLNVDLSLYRFERRGLLQSCVVPGSNGVPVFCFCTHLDLLQKNRREQLLHVCRHIREVVPPQAPLVLAGDFNDWTKKASPILEQQLGVRDVFSSCHGKYARTFPSKLRLLPLDRIYVRGLKAVNPKVLRHDPWRHLSDHVPIFTELVLEQPQRAVLRAEAAPPCPA